MIQRTSCKTRHSAARPNDDRKKESASSEPASYGFHPDTILLYPPRKTQIHLQQMVGSFNMLPGRFAAWLSLVNSCLAATVPSLLALSTQIVVVRCPSNSTTLESYPRLSGFLMSLVSTIQALCNGLRYGTDLDVDGSFSVIEDVLAADKMEAFHMRHDGSRMPTALSPLLPDGWLSCMSY